MKPASNDRAALRTPTALALALSFLAITGLGAAVGDCGPVLVQEVIDVPGHVEPHTPGAPGVVASPKIVQLLGADPDLNRVHYVRTSVEKASGEPPRTILILIPGFLGGGTTFDPLARELVLRSGGQIEVWAVDRRTNQLEDRSGGTYALDHAVQGILDGDDAAVQQAFYDGAQFYFADLDVAPLGDFPGPGDLDLDLDGVLDPQLPLPDGFGVTRTAIIFEQNDLRSIFSHWGIDLYMRDWLRLAEAAREIVGPDGLVLMGGHSQGTTWSTTFAAYDFDPDPAVVDAGHSHIDGLVLLEGGGVGPGQATKPSLAEYQATIDTLLTESSDPGAPTVFLDDLFGFGIAPVDLGPSGEIAAIAGRLRPDDASIIQRTPIFGSGLASLVLSTPATNEAVVGLFLDDDFSLVSAFKASMGFTDNGPNSLFLGAYRTSPAAGDVRRWKQFDDPTLPTCPPATYDPAADGGVGCAIRDMGPPSAPGESPKTNGVQAEVTAMTDFLDTQFGKANGFEWYFVSGRVNLDFSYGNDSSALVAEALAIDPGDEGPLTVTQNASVAIPVIGIGGSNGLTPETKSFDRYFESIATPAADKQAHVLEGYAHVDVINARSNAAVPLLLDWVSDLQVRKLLGEL